MRIDQSASGRLSGEDVTDFIHLEPHCMQRKESRARPIGISRTRVKAEGSPGRTVQIRATGRRQSRRPVDATRTRATWMRSISPREPIATDRLSGGRNQPVRNPPAGLALGLPQEEIVDLDPLVE